MAGNKPWLLKKLFGSLLFNINSCQNLAFIQTNIWYHSKTAFITRNISNTFQVSESKKLQSQACAVVTGDQPFVQHIHQTTPNVPTQDQNTEQRKWGGIFHLFLNQAIVWRLKIVLKYAHILNFILWNRIRLPIISVYLKVAFFFLVFFKWVKAGIVSYISTEGNHFRRQAILQTTPDAVNKLAHERQYWVHCKHWAIPISKYESFPYNAAMGCLSFCSSIRSLTGSTVC